MRIFVDGSVEPGNPGGTVGYGFHVDGGHFEYDGYGNAFRGGESASNNVAEYMAVAAALTWFLPYASVNDHPPDGELEILSDSQLVVNQLNGEWRVRHSNVKPIAAVTHLLIEQLNQLGWVVKATWIPREENRLADKLSRRATNEGLKDRLPLTRREESE